MDPSMFAKVMKELAAAFVLAKRDDGSTFWRLADAAPSWLQGDAGATVMREIHESLDDRMPDDWVYEAASSVADAFVDHKADDADSARDDAHEIADGLVDVYNADRLRWLASHLGNAAIVDEACAELGCEPDADTFTRIGIGQYEAYSRIANAVIDAVNAEAESRDEGEEGPEPLGDDGRLPDRLVPDDEMALARALADLGADNTADDGHFDGMVEEFACGSTLARCLTEKYKPVNGEEE